MNTAFPRSEAPPRTWEQVLFGWAHQAHDCANDGAGSDVDAGLLAAAYAECDRITEAASKTFFLASGLLPTAKRRAARALYAFCRVSDDLVDRGHDPVRGDLAAWRARILAPHPAIAAGRDPVALAWADTRARHDIPACLSEQFFDGLARDLSTARYETFDDMAEYAYGVASTVGLMVMHIVGFDGPRAIPYAVKLGVALQLTNILRDLAEDWQAGRLYLPLQELAAFGLSEGDIDRGEVTPAWRAFMAYQIGRNRRLYDEAAPGIGMLHPEGRFAIGAAADLYRGILDDIEAHDYDVFRRRAHLTTAGKLRRIPGIWWRARVRGYGAALSPAMEG